MKKIREYWRSAKERFRILKGVSNVIKLLFETNSTFWVERSLSEELPEIKTGTPVEFNFSSAAETIDCIKSFKERWMNHPREIEIALRENHFFSNAKYNGNIIAIWKTGINKVYVDDYRKVLAIAPKVAFAYHMYVAPEFRNQRISEAVFVMLMHELRDRGFRKIIGYFAPWNIRSMNCTMKIGFKKIAYIRHFRILNTIKFWFIQDFAAENKQISFSLSRLYQLIS